MMEKYDLNAFLFFNLVRASFAFLMIQATLQVNAYSSVRLFFKYTITCHKQRTKESNSRRQPPIYTDDTKRTSF